MRNRSSTKKWYHGEVVFILINFQGIFNLKSKISTELYSGQGLGNQLWVYATAFTLASAKGFDLKIKSSWRFKGKYFLKLPMGTRKIYTPRKKPKRLKIQEWTKGCFYETKTLDTKFSLDLSAFDVHLFKIQKSTQLYGNFESEKYLEPSRESIIRLFQTQRSFEMPTNLCVIVIRGGDFLGNSTISLPAKYYLDAISYVKSKKPNMEFGVVTDDPDHATMLLPEIMVLSQKSKTAHGLLKNLPDHEKIRTDFSLIQCASSIILGNSSFGWWGAWTNMKTDLVIAPRFWQAFNLSNGIWAPRDILTRNWLWLGKDGVVRSYDEELRVLKENMEQEQNYLTSDTIVTTSNWFEGRTRYRLRSKLFRLRKKFMKIAYK